MLMNIHDLFYKEYTVNVAIHKGAINTSTQSTTDILRTGGVCEGGWVAGCCPLVVQND